MTAKRTTRTNADTLNTVRKQAYEAGREAGRQDLAIELARELEHDALRDLWVWLMGRCDDGKAHHIVTSGRDALKAALSASARVLAEASKPAF